MKSKLEYIDDLGSNTIWLSGIYKVDKNDVGFQGIVNHMELAEDIGVSAETLKAWIKKRAKEGRYTSNFKKNVSPAPDIKMTIQLQLIYY